jgi:hypothetical protein
MFSGAQVPSSLAAFVALVIIIPLLNAIFDWAAVNVTIQQLQAALRRQNTSEIGDLASRDASDKARLGFLGCRIGGVLIGISALAPALLLALFAFCAEALEAFFGDLGVEFGLLRTLEGGLRTTDIFLLVMLYSTALPAYFFVVAAMLTFGEALVWRCAEIIADQKVTSREALVMSLEDGRNVAFYSMGFWIVVMLAGICLLVGLYIPWAFTRTFVYPAVVELIAS